MKTVAKTTDFNLSLEAGEWEALSLVEKCRARYEFGLGGYVSSRSTRLWGNADGLDERGVTF